MLWLWFIGAPLSRNLKRRYENFSQFAVAHLFLYGILKDFYAVWCDPNMPKNRADVYTESVHNKSTSKARYAWPPYIKQQIVDRADSIQATRQWSIAGANVTWCVT